MATGLPDYFSRVFSEMLLQFTDLQDTPGSYEDEANKNVRVNQAESGLEFGGAYFDSGVDADKGEPGRKGRVWWATDSERLYYDDGTDWIEILRSEATTRLASLAEQSFASLTNVNVDDVPGLLNDDQHVLDAEVLAVVEQYLLWMIDINAFATPKSNTNWLTIQLDPNQIGGGYTRSSGAQNDSIAWDVLLASGTWTVEILHVMHYDLGIYSIQFNGVEKGTIDGYKATPPTFNNRSSITGIVVATTSKIELKLKMATKNGSATAYTGIISGVRLMRTA